MAQYWFFAHFLPQADFPWPSKVPPPEMVRKSTRLKATQVSPPLNPAPTAGACNVPWRLNSMGALQGPWRFTWVTLYVPLGTTTLLELFDAQAFFQVFNKIYFKNAQQLLNEHEKFITMCLANELYYIYSMC